MSNQKQLPNGIEIQIGDSWVNNNPEIPGELLIASLPDKNGWVKCVHVQDLIHGLVELKTADTLLEFYHKLKT